MSHPLEAYLSDDRNGIITDEEAKDSISGLVNDPALLQEVCARFTEDLNSDARCYAVGKVYDVEDRRYGCIAIMSEDVVNVIGHDTLEETHEKINYVLLCAFLEYKRFCADAGSSFEAWDDYLDFSMQRNFPALFNNGIRARLMHTDSIRIATLPTVVFVVFQNYSAL
jgi:hypothetical protein